MTSYWDIDSILCEDVHVPGVFTVDAVNLGYMDPSSVEEDLKEGTEVQLPFWLLTALSARNMVTVESPGFYGARFRTELLAEPSVVDLRSRCPYYYELGVKAASAFADRDLLPSLMKCLVARYRLILDTAQNSQNEDTTKFTRNLTELELVLYRSGFIGASRFFLWKNRLSDRLTASSTIKMRPRKRRKR